MSTTDLIIILLTLGSALYFLVIGVILKRRSIRDGVGGILVFYVTTFFLWMLGLAGWQLGGLGSSANAGLIRSLFYGLLLLSLLFFQLNWLFLRLPGIPRFWWGSGLICLTGVIVLNENLFSWPDLLWTGQGWRVSLGILGWASLMCGAAFLTARSYYRTYEPLHRNRLTYWFVVLGLIVTGAALFLGGRAVVGSSFYLAGILAAVYVMLNYRLPDIRQIARRTISYVIITLLTVIIYTAGILATQYAFQSVPGYSPYIAGATIALVLAIFFDPLLHLVQGVVNRIISGTTYDPNRTLREYSTSISNIVNLERLATVALGLISEAMETRRGVLFVASYEEEEEAEGYFQLRGVGGMGEALRLGVLAANSPVAHYLRQEYHPLTQYDIDLLPRFRDTSPVERAWLTELNMTVYVPVYAKGEWIGLFALGPKASGDRYFDHDLTLLSTLADQTAVALENARLFEDLMVRNIEIENLNRELTEVNHRLAHLDQAKSDFIGVASHELRTPLTHIRGYNDMLNDILEAGALTPEEGLKLTQGVQKGVERLQEIVNTMFDVSQIDTETLNLKTSSISVMVIIKAAVENMTKALAERKQTLTVEGLENLPFIMADGERLKQVFMQLIQNAIKYTPDEGQILITGRVRDEGLVPEYPMVEIVVADTGIGIASEDLERIFEKFYRVGEARLHSTGATKFKGAGPGLGLTIARGIVKAHGGRIWAESPGYDEECFLGSEFHVVLPIHSSRLELAGSETFISSSKI